MGEYMLTLNLPQIENSYARTQTEVNLWKALIGESIARNRYSYYASQAKKEGYEQLSALISQIADNEKEHAKIWFRRLGQLQDFEKNLNIAANGEHHEWSEMYTAFAEDARRDGFPQTAMLFEEVAEIEKRHERIFRQMLQLLEHENMFSRKDVVMWECRNCGHIEISETAPAECPVCSHPQSYFQVAINSL